MAMSRESRLLHPTDRSQLPEIFESKEAEVYSHLLLRSHENTSVFEDLLILRIEKIILITDNTSW
jgi:hypothetical protein